MEKVKLVSYFVDPVSPTVLSSKRVNGAIGLIAGIVIGVVTRDIALTALFLGLTGVEGLATAFSKR